MLVLLIGFLGAGKTSIGTLLSRELGYNCIEMDDYILEKTNFSSVTEAYKENMSEWKEKEVESSKELSQKDNTVLIGTAALVENNVNFVFFKNNNKDLKVIYLQTQPEILSKRMVNLYHEFKKTGPSLVLRAMEKYYQKRHEHYTQYADLIVNTDDSTPEDVCGEILKKLGVTSKQSFV